MVHFNPPGKVSLLSFQVKKNIRAEKWVDLKGDETKSIQLLKDKNMKLNFEWYMNKNNFVPYVQKPLKQRVRQNNEKVCLFNFVCHCVVV